VRPRAVAQFLPNNPVHTAAPNANSGDRMALDLMNAQPTDDDFQAAPNVVSRGLVIRALQRYVDDIVMRAIDLLHPANANTSDGLDKVMLSRKFMHNSQRAHWALAVLNWARGQVLPAAMNMVILAIT
jgi:hypothetical protein